MRRRTFVKVLAAAGGSLAAPTLAFAQTDAGTPTHASEGAEVPNTAPQTGYAPVNGLRMYYEIHGSAAGGQPPLVVLHGAYMTIGAMGPVVPALAATRQVIAVEQQGHGHTADIDRPLTYEQMADDTAALLRHLGIDQVDVFGYSMGGGIGLQLAVRHPDLVRKLVVASMYIDNAGAYPEIFAAIESITPEVFMGTPWYEEYARVAPNPEDFPALVAKLKELDLTFPGFPEDDIRAIAAPTLLIVGDADILRPEHAVEVFQLLGGGVPGDLVGLPRARLAILPGTTHITVMERTDWLLSMTEEFLDAPVPPAA